MSDHIYLFIPADLGGEKRNNGRYEQFKYHYWGYAKVAANRHEIPPSRNTNLSAPYQNTHGISQRNLRPRRLCLLQEDEGIDIVDVSEWEADNGTLDYLFICYTTLQFSYDSIDDMEELHRISESAARQAGVNAYWVACSCMPDDEECSEDVYRISDIVRGAHSLVVIIGPPPGSTPSVSEMLRELGSRMWNFPEVLLSPSNKTILVYMRDCDTDYFRVLSKRNLAWDDALISRQLIDHYESSILLSPLDLVSLALECIPNRDTVTYYEGDLSYA
ncbi:uncharacterized protein N7483_004823 [Penicillium malachiteum]|uniref:uncharacterized protein n=1 Tax=Penicillium malachiteum TaxID=1324776 RepID=UPI0025491ED6|nr:uncharacterized protein N7483_004823 [Penicillium malachiteum]KAJ5730315.1 hypothetical protein N7483_004823 [Penicillium malachiteum]